ncbi:MAG: BamA/TamA family outer membrane protein, partial [Bacteroidota bacterium]
ETRTSNLPLSVTYTLENQYVFFSGFEIFTNQEKFVITGRAFYTQFPRLYYGIGRETPASNEELYDFKQLVLEPRLLKRMFFKYLFIGGGIRLNDVSDVTFESDGLLADNDQTGELGSRSLGGEFAILFDSRNNILYADRGWFGEFSYGIYDKKIGSSSNFELLRFDLRHYLTPWKKNKDILAFHVRTQFSFGDVPIADRAWLGGDEIMRGYYEGRFIDNHLIAFQTEYRKVIKNRLGAVVFAGLGDVASDFGDFQLNRFRPSVGFGLRFMLDPRENLNLRFDYGIGKGEDNFYLNIAEAF